MEKVNFKMKTYFLTYGDKSFKYSKKHLCALAEHSGFFDKILSLGPENLNYISKKIIKIYLTKTRVADIGFGNMK